MGIDFENTAVAFEFHSNRDLKRAHWLFWVLNRRIIVRVVTFFVQLALRVRLPIEGWVRKTLYRQFVGGETIEACEPTIVQLSRFRVRAILDYAVEGNHTEEAFESTHSEILRTIQFAKINQLPFCVFKVTAIARAELLLRRSAKEKLDAVEGLEWERVRARFFGICEKSFREGVRVLVDAEESWIQGAIDDLAVEAMERFNAHRAIVYNTLQMYRTDRLKFLEMNYELAKQKKYLCGVKLVRGAYLEKELAHAKKEGQISPLLPTKFSTDLQFDQAIDFILSDFERFGLCLGTHNENSTRFLVDLMHKRGINSKDSRIYFAQLYGMSDHLSFNLAKAGYNVAKYVPYGPVREVVPYLIRRAEENTSVRGQSSRELALIQRELTRRRGSKAKLQD